MYCNDLFKYSRRKTLEVKVGDVGVGGDNPIRIQSMTTLDTMDTNGSVEECIRMIESGCEIIRLTAPSIKEAENLRNIKNELLRRGYSVPLVADIHFTPNAAEVAAKIVEKVRVNPGNYADKKKFDIIEYDDAAYQEELNRIKERFTPLVQICKEHNTAMRIGTNHGSLSDRILSRFGDTPIGMVESALEFIRICEELEYFNLIVSMKASNTRVMVQAYRLLVEKLQEEGLKPYPLHLGVTEAGEGEDGRIKSAVGIGTLLEDGLGDTVRVSLTEDPEFESPVAKILVDRYLDRGDHEEIKEIKGIGKDPFVYERRETKSVLNFGGSNVPRVLADFSDKKINEFKDLTSIGHVYNDLLDKWAMLDLGADFIYTGQYEVPFMLPNGLKQIVDYEAWVNLKDKKHAYPLWSFKEFACQSVLHEELNFVLLQAKEVNKISIDFFTERENIVFVIETKNKHEMPAIRRTFYELIDQGCKIPVVIKSTYSTSDEEKLQLYSATNLGGLLIDGLGDGLLIQASKLSKNIVNKTAFGVLQAARTRMTKTEYISCPSCGRTLFDLQKTTALIREQTDHLKGVKIGIMGCIVNGPGEMADADYGYVGSGPDKITLYKGQDVVERGVPSSEAVGKLIEIIKDHGDWIDPILN